MFFLVPTPTVTLSLHPGPVATCGTDNVSIICSANVDMEIVNFGSLGYNYTWVDELDTVVMTSKRTVVRSPINSNYSTLTLSPVSVEDTNFMCTVSVYERMNMLTTSAPGNGSIKINVQSNY